MEFTMDTKETLEVFDAADTACDAVIKACEDGKIGIMDIRHLLAPVKAVSVAMQGRDKLKEELKDLDAAEMEELAFRGVMTAEKVAAAFTAIAGLEK
jgi:hypothetical protein